MDRRISIIKGYNLSNLLSNLNDEQKEVVTSTSSKICCIAGAGTGKTHTLISRIVHLVNYLDVDPRSVLSLTFTNAAAAEMNSRYLAYSCNPITPKFATFHSFCYSLIREDEEVRNRIGYKNIPDIITAEEEKVFQAQAQIQTSAKLPKKGYSITYKPNIREKFQFTVFQKALDGILIQNNKITFDRLCYRICELFEKNDKSISKYKQKYQYVLIDEFQDTDPLQWKFVQSFESTSNILVCGDIFQAIYGFRGADSSIMKSIVSDESWNVLKLQTNYRSTQEICDYGNQIIDEIEADPESKVNLKAIKSGKSVIESKSSKLENLFKDITSLKGTTAILCRTNREVGYISSLLTSKGIPHRLKESDEFNSLCVAAIDPYFYKSYLLGKLSTKDRSKILSYQYAINSNEINIIEELEKRLPEVVEQINDIQNSENFETLVELYKVNPGALSLGNYNFNDHNLYVGTIHSVKGLEFDNVYVYGVDSSSFRLNSEESYNLYYVASTRAKTNLTVLFE